MLIYMLPIFGLEPMTNVCVFVKLKEHSIETMTRRSKGGKGLVKDGAQRYGKFCEIISKVLANLTSEGWQDVDAYDVLYEETREVPTVF